MAAKFKVGDLVEVPTMKHGIPAWWVGKPATVRAVFEDTSLYEVLFHDGQDFAFIEEDKLAPLEETDKKPASES
jgi:hypothetical protein